MDKRYFIETVHGTMFRFTKPFEGKEEFIIMLEDFKDYDFGQTRINEMEMDYNDWYMKEKIFENIISIQSLIIELICVIFGQ